MEATFNCRQEDNGVRSGVPRREPLLARILQVATLGTLALLAGAAPAFVEPEPLESEAIAK